MPRNRKREVIRIKAERREFIRIFCRVRTGKDLLISEQSLYFAKSLRISIHQVRKYKEARANMSEKTFIRLLKLWPVPLRILVDPRCMVSLEVAQKVFQGS